jgi:isoleucyl-tRNA synthetase
VECLQFLRHLFNLDGWQPLQKWKVLLIFSINLSTRNLARLLGSGPPGRDHPAGDREARILRSFSATSAVQIFLEDLTNWYVRRSRRRFWKNECDDDKNSAYTTLYHVLVKLARLLAPFTPFVVETIYRNLVLSIHPQACYSVHHTAWPKVPARPELDDDDLEVLLERMARVRELVSLGLNARNNAGLKVRQPLAKAFVYLPKDIKVFRVRYRCLPWGVG